MQHMMSKGSSTGESNGEIYMQGGAEQIVTPFNGKVK